MRNRLFPTLNRKFASVPQRAKLSVYQGVGHSPFFEDAPRFNAELAAFVRGAHKAN
jgi:pimeloyl-ACP methyl ester carboxylesterase